MSGREADAAVRRAVTLQTWSDASFLHWRLTPAAAQAMLPAGLTVEVLDGSAWLGVVAFRMQDVRPAGLPALPGWSDFPELNVRIYVRGPDGHDGVWFRTLLCPRRAFVWALRRFGVAYRYAGAGLSRRGTAVSYRFVRDHGPDRLAFEARLEVGAPMRQAERTPLIDSLTGRWNAYSTVGGRLLRIPVEHEPWPLHAATLRSVRLRAAPDGFALPTGAPMVHFSPGVHARIGPPVVVG